jgi:PAS domain S-box-containing protein
MFPHWFLSDQTPLAACHQYHRVTWLVIGTYLASAFAAYAAFDMVARARLTTVRSERRLWLGTAGLSMGLGIWVMGVVSMLMVEIPLPPGLDLPLTALSGAFPVLACIIAFQLMLEDHGRRGRLLLAGLLLGGGIAATHYIGMEALRVPVSIVYAPSLFGLSVVVPMALSATALMALSTVPLFGERHLILARVAGALVMGMAPLLTHYTAMFAAWFCPRADAVPTMMQNPALRTAAIAVGAILVVGMALLAVLFDRRVERAEGFLRDATESLSEGFVIFDRDGRFVLCNEAWRRLSRVSDDVLVPGTKLEAFLRDDFRAERYAGAGEDEAEWVSGQLRIRMSRNTSYEHHMSDGTWLLMSNRGMRDGCVAGLWIDITARKASEAALREEKRRLDLDSRTVRSTRAALREREQRLDRAQEITCTGTWEIDETSGRVFWSAEMYRIRDLSPDPAEMHRRDHRQGIHPDDLPLFEDWLNRLRHGGEPGPIEYRVRRSSGEEWVVLAQARGIADPSGAVTRIVGTESDVTERRRMEDQLVQARRMRRVGQLAGGLVREFNNSLGAIIGNLDLVAERAAQGSETARLCGVARESAQYAADTIRDLVTFAETKTSAPGSDDPAEVFARLLPVVRRALGGNVQVETRLDAELWSGGVDTDQIEAAVLDLAAFAGGTLPAGGTLALDVRHQTLTRPISTASGDLGPGDYLTVGLGVARNLLASTDRSDERGPKEPAPGGQATGRPSTLTTRADEGVGEAVARMRHAYGMLDVETNQGTPTAVRLWLPAAGEEAPAASEGESPHVLMVEPNVEMGHLGCRILRSLGYRVTLVARGEDAAELIERGSPFDLLFCDFALPGRTSGLALGKAARARDPDARVLFASGFATAVIPRGALNALGAEVIRKPYRKHDLARLMRASLKKGRKRTAVMGPSLAMTEADGQESRDTAKSDMIKAATPI